jgi:hypothetical protein
MPVWKMGRDLVKS